MKTLKEKLDFLNKEIGELDWIIATIFYGRKAILEPELRKYEEMLSNYRINKEYVLEEIKTEVRNVNANARRQANNKG